MLSTDFSIASWFACSIASLCLLWLAMYRFFVLSISVGLLLIIAFEYSFFLALLSFLLLHKHFCCCSFLLSLLLSYIFRWCSLDISLSLLLVYLCWLYPSFQVVAGALGCIVPIVPLFLFSIFCMSHFFF